MQLRVFSCFTYRCLQHQHFPRPAKTTFLNVSPRDFNKGDEISACWRKGTIPVRHMANRTLHPPHALSIRNYPNYTIFFSITRFHAHKSWAGPSPGGASQSERKIYRTRGQPIRWIYLLKKRTVIQMVVFTGAEDSQSDGVI
jgi:hypothetical protein